MDHNPHAHPHPARDRTRSTGPRTPRLLWRRSVGLAWDTAVVDIHGRPVCRDSLARSLGLHSLHCPPSWPRKESRLTLMVGILSASLASCVGAAMQKCCLPLVQAEQSPEDLSRPHEWSRVEPKRPRSHLVHLLLLPHRTAREAIAPIQNGAATIHLTRRCAPLTLLPSLTQF